MKIISIAGFFAGAFCIFILLGGEIDFPENWWAGILSLVLGVFLGWLGSLAEKKALALKKNSSSMTFLIYAILSGFGMFISVTLFPFASVIILLAGILLALLFLSPENEYPDD